MAATKAKSYLKSQVAKAREDMAVPGMHSALPAMSHTMEVHYSFDFAQQVGCPRKQEHVNTVKLIF